MDVVYVFGVGIFFLGYVFFEVLLNFIMCKVGVKIWFVCIMVLWGIVFGFMVFVMNEWIFYIL